MLTLPRYPQLCTVPNALTLMRLVGVLPFVLLSAQAQQANAVWARWGVLLLFAGIAGSDVLDGWLARRLGQVTLLGRTLDHVCDVVFILTALGAFVAYGLIPWWLPAAIAWSFGLYVIDSWWRTAGRAHRQLLGSRLGHVGGTLYYVTVGVVTGQIGTDSRWLPPILLQGWCLSLALLALFSGVERLYYLGRAFSRPAPAERVAENTPRSGR
jgi:cardiolipin synthase